MDKNLQKGGSLNLRRQGCATSQRQGLRVRRGTNHYRVGAKCRGTLCENAPLVDLLSRLELGDEIPQNFILPSLTSLPSRTK